MFLAVLDARLNVLKIQMLLFGFVPRQEMFLKIQKFKNVLKPFEHRVKCS